MGRISVGEALGEGFRLIGREPVAFAVWCVLQVVMQVVVPLSLAPIMGPALAAAATGGTAQLPPAIFGYQFAFFFVLLAVWAVLSAAIFRAILRPDERRFFYLRLGMRELWIFVTLVVLGLMVIPVAFATFLPTMLAIGIVGFMLGLAGPAGAILAAILSFLAMIGAFAALLWVMLRFSLAPVASFAESGLRLGRSWTLTKGKGWRVFLVGLGYLGIVLLAEMVLVGIGFAVVVGATPNFLQLMQTNPNAAFAAVGPFAATAASVILGLFSTWSLVLGSAAWASLYRQLKPTLAETFA